MGVDNIDAEAATRRGIVVMNTPGANAVAVAELTIGLMLALARKLPAANASMHAGKWEKKNLQGAELRGKTLGILGLGRIGLEVAKRARGFGLEIIGSDPFVSAAVARENGITLVTLDELFAGSDYLTLHVGLTPQTTGIINAKTLATMKKGVRIINCARGELVEDAALVAALKSGQVAGAALDVFTVEPPKDSPYFGLDNVILTPHIAGSTAEAQEAVGVQIATQVRDYLKLGVVQNAVNLPSLSHEEYVQLAPYIDMAGRLGAFLAQAGKGGIESIDLVYGGTLAEAKTELVRNAAIAGLLQGSENVNRINAAAVAQERGIRIHEEKAGDPSRRRGQRAHHRTAHRHTAPAAPAPPSFTASSRACSSSTPSTSKRRSKAICSSAATSTSPASSAESAPSSASTASTSPTSPSAASAPAPSQSRPSPSSRSTRRFRIRCSKPSAPSKPCSKPAPCNCRNRLLTSSPNQFATFKQKNHRGKRWLFLFGTESNQARLR